MEIVVDCYHEWEQSLGWYYYLQDTITFPFKAKCILQKGTSPLTLNEIVNVIGMGTENDCKHDMLVKIKWNARELSIPLSQLEAINIDDKTKQALGDWDYWLDQGYNF